MSADERRHGEWDKGQQQYADGWPSHPCDEDGCVIWDGDWEGNTNA